MPTPLSRVELFQSRPWLKGTLPLTRTPVGMLGEREALLFYHLTKDAFTGKGTVIDAGSFLGKSAVCLATGLLANPRFDAERDRVHCFDNFRVNEGFTVDYVREKLNKELVVGQSTRPLFDEQVADVKHVIEAHEGDFQTIPWQRRPIEILMVDIAKSVELGRRVIELFFRDLIPGTSLVVHQDYHLAGLPHVNVTMEFLADSFEIVVPRCDDSAVFACRAPISDAALERVLAYDFTADEQVELMERAVRRLSPKNHGYLELARVMLIGTLRGWSEAKRAFEEAEPRLHAFQGEYGWERSLGETRDHIDEKLGWAGKERGDKEGTLRIADAMLARGRANASALVMRGWALTQLGRHAEGEQSLRTCLDLPVHPGPAYFELAFNLLAQGRPREAEAEVMRCASDKTAYPTARSRHLFIVLATIWQTSYVPEVARTMMADLQQRFAQDPEFWAFDARLHAKCGRRAEAVSSARRAHELELPDDSMQFLIRDTGLSPTELQVGPRP